MVGGADFPFTFHPFNEARGVVVADAKLALDVAGRRLLALGDGLHGLLVALCLVVVVAHRLAFADIAAVLRLLGARHIIFGRPLAGPMVDHGAHLPVGYASAVAAGALLCAGHINT